MSVDMIVDDKHIGIYRSSHVAYCRDQNELMKRYKISLV